MSDFEPDFTILEESTTSNEEQEINNQAEPEAVNESDSAPQEEKQNTENETDDAEQAESSSEPEAPKPFLSIKYNHENIDMTEEEVRNTVQLAKKNEALLASLDYLAAQNDETISEFVKRLEEASDNALLERLRDRYGDMSEDEINELADLQRNKNKEKYDAVLANRKKESEEAAKNAEQSLNERMANELIEVQEVFPEIKEFNDLPEKVRKAALSGGDLMKEYLKFLHSEAEKIKQNKAAEQKAANAASGSVKSPEQTEESAEMSEFLKGLWG